MAELIPKVATVLAAIAVVGAGCSGRTSENGATSGNTGASTATGGATGSSGTTSLSGAGGRASSAGSGADATSGGVSSAGSHTPNGGAAVAGGTAGATNEAGDSTTGGAAASPDPDAILQVKPSTGCGKDPMQGSDQFVKYTIQTSGTKDADCADSKCGAWAFARDYYVWLPPGYDKNRAYPLVFQAPGCSGVGSDVYSLSPTNTDVGAGVGGSVIRVGLTPPPNSIGHATNPNQGCFDDKEGDDSVDWVFYEALIDELQSELCYDENRVFASGNSSGAWLANELACKYAGNAHGYAIRGIAVNGGGLPTQPGYEPTCTSAPMAGTWVVEEASVSDAVDPNRYAIARAMKVNGCSPGTSYPDSQHQDFAIGGGNPDTVCQKISGCPDLYPLVVCTVPASPPSSHESVANPAFATFLKALEAP